MGWQLDVLVLLGHDVPGQPVVVTAAVHADSNHGFGCRARRPEHGNRRQSLVIQLRDQESFFRPDFLPDLADLDSLTRHLNQNVRLERTSPGVNRCPCTTFHPSRGNLFYPGAI